jgi:hypothetical protein
MVLKAAIAESLIVACGYCCDNKGTNMKILLSICFGCYPRLKDEKDDDAWEVMDRLARPRYVHNVPTNIKFTDVTSGTDELVLVKNHLYDTQVGLYLDQNWTKNLPTIHSGVCRIAFVARNAVVENSNGNNEGGFRHSKHDASYVMACKDPSTYLHHYAMNSRMHAARMIDQLRHLNHRVEETNNRKQKVKLMQVLKKSGRGEIDDDEVMDSFDVKWIKKPDILTELLEKLEHAMKFHGIEEVDEQFDVLEEHANKIGGEFVLKRTFKKWMDPATRGLRKNKQLPAWNVIRGHVKENPIEDKNIENDCKSKEYLLGEEVSTVPALPKAESFDSYEKITDAHISMVMNDNPTADDNIGELVLSIRRFRGKFGLIANHATTVIPQQIMHVVEKFIRDVLKCEEVASSWICEDDEIVDKLVLRESEMMGSIEYKNCLHPTVMNGRKIIGVNIPAAEPAWHSRYSVTLAAGYPLDEIFHKVFMKIPETLFPDKGENPESMGDKIVKSKFIDVIYSWFQSKSPNSLNENISSRQAIRRTTGMVKKRPHFFHTQLPPGEEEGDNRSVVTLYGYPNPECPTNLWMCFAQTKLEYAQGVHVWMKAWSSLSCVSRKRPPNGCQMLIYHRLLKRKMGRHRDNNPGSVMLNMVNGSETPWGNNPRVGGSENSQVRGSSVMVFSRGCPMTMTLRYALPEREVTQQSKHYITSPSFQMRMEDGWITVLDPIDDMLMVHSVDWPDDGDEASRDETADVRVAWVYRWLGVTHDYYVQGCTVRRTREMMKTNKRNVVTTNDDLEREMV